MLIGLSGWARSGKDTVGSVLAKMHGFTRVAFADLLRECVYVLNPWIPISELRRTDQPVILGEEEQPPAMRLRRLQSIVDHDGWEAAKAIPEVRRLLQRMGTEVGRDILDSDIWVKAAFDRLDERKDYVFTDVRFPNEFDALRDTANFTLGTCMAYGEVWRINRPGVQPVSDHESEVALNEHEFDAWILNDGAISDLHAKVDKLVFAAKGREAAYKDRI